MKRADPALVSAHANLKVAERLYEEEMAKIQAACDHPVIAHFDGITTYSNTNPRRICVRCRLEEVGTRWSGKTCWMRNDHGKAILDNNDDRLIVETRDWTYLRDPTEPLRN